jgi:hypothetical protein
MPQDLSDNSFSPFALIETERTVPRPMFVALLIGIDTLLRISLDERKGRQSFVQQALQELDQRLKRWNGVLPGFGRPAGFTIAYDQARAVRFDLSGKAVAVITPATRLPEASLAIRNRTVWRSSNSSEWP